MAKQAIRVSSKTLPVRVQGSMLLQPDEVAEKIENMEPTDEGGLRTIQGPTPYLPYYSASYPNNTTSLFTVNFAAQYRDITHYAELSAGRSKGWKIHGIFHATLNRGQREVLLLHNGKELWHFCGWKHGWERLICEDSGAGVNAKLPDSVSPSFPTQFAATSNGIVIVPQEGRAYFYDGEQIAPLGFAVSPGAPTALGPQSSIGAIKSDMFFGAGQSSTGSAATASEYDEALWDSGNSDPLINNKGYAHDGLWEGPWQPGMDTAMHFDLGKGRVGTPEALDPSVLQDDNQTVVDVLRGYVRDGEYRYAVQYLDRWGNLSPLSAPSNSAIIRRQSTIGYEWRILAATGDDTGDSGEDAYRVQTPNYLTPDCVLKQIACTNIPVGPDHTVGRILFRTRDLKNSGTAAFFEIPQNSGGGEAALATLPDNFSQIYPDNTPDSWLNAPAYDPIAVPEFKLCTAAFGRLFIANEIGNPGAVRFSVPGRFGTFLRSDFFFPDPSGGEITGLAKIAAGILCFTKTSTFLIEPNDTGSGFAFRTLNSNVGCVAPSSIATMRNSHTVWLGKEGFYMFVPGEGIRIASVELSSQLRRINTARAMQACAAVDTRTGEYRCWVSTDGNIENNMCFVFDGRGWRQRTDVQASAVCTTRDHRPYMIAAGLSHGGYTPAHPDGGGEALRTGVWLLDHGTLGYAPRDPNDGTQFTATVETGWLTGLQSKERKTAVTVYIWMRETKKDTITVGGSAATAYLSVTSYRDWRKEELHTEEVTLHPAQDPPSFLSSTALAASGAVWEKRRPYWAKADIFVPGAETFKLKLSYQGDWEFLGLSFDALPSRGAYIEVPK